jgi:hypothetical protein
MAAGEVKADAVIIVFGAAVLADGQPSGTMLRRVGAAVRFGKGFRRPVFVPTGGKGRFGDAEAAVMARLLAAAGVAEGSVVREETATDTLSSVRAVAAILRGLPGVPAYACTSAYHLPRCLVLLRLAGIVARPVPPPLAPAAAGWRKRWLWRLREVPALPYDAALVLWHRARGRL